MVCCVVDWAKFDNNVPHGIVVFPFTEKMDQSFAGFDYNNINIWYEFENARIDRFFHEFGA